MTTFFDFIKKPPSNSNQNNQQDISSINLQEDDKIVTANQNNNQNEDKFIKQPVAYSGIGKPPAGQSYSGIGKPPTGQAYSGISQPPSQKNIQENSNNQKQDNNQSFDQSTIKKVSQTENTDKKNTNNKQAEIDLITHLTQRSNRVLMMAQNKVKELKGEYLDSEHLLYGLTTDQEIYQLLLDVRIQPQLVQEELNKVYQRGNNDKQIQFSPRVKKIINDSLVVARKLGFEFIAPEHLLIALYEEGEGAGARILAKLGLQKEELNKKITGKKEGLLTEEEKKQAKKKQVLEDYTIDLTAKASQGLLDPVVERSVVIERVIHILSRRTKNNPCLTGEAGVGKTAIIEGLAQKIISKEVPESLLNKRILQLDLMSILAGASHRGEFEERMKDLLEQIKGSNGQIILFIDEIHNIVGAGSSGEGSLDASNFLKPALARGELQLIGVTTITEYRKYIEKDPALERRFQPVFVPEPTEEQAIKMLTAIKDKYEAFHKVKVPPEAIETAVKLSKKYIGDRFLPDKAIDLIDEAASAVRLPLISLPEEIRSLELRIKELSQEKAEAEKKGDKVKMRILNSKIDEINSDLKVKQEEYNLKKSQTTGAISTNLIRDIISRWTGIPVSKITSSETERLAHLEEIIHKRLINQEEAVIAISQAIRRGRAGLKSANRPIGSFVFLGPTGVGKTELAKTLADVLFDSEDSVIRFDMTEYMEKHEVAKLLGAPPGYVGYEEGGKLTEAVRRKPYSVVLFDEIEKAHPDIFNILLQILDDGRLTDNKGRVISFKNTVVICTSNIGTKLIQEEMVKNYQSASVDSVDIDNNSNQDNKEKNKEKTVNKDKNLNEEKKKEKEVKKEKSFEEIKEKVMAELLKFFRPELVNRFDEVIIFEPLRYEDIMKIIKLQLNSLQKLLEDQGIDLSYDDSVIEEIVQIGFDPFYGARPLKRVIQKLIENPLSSLIIENKVKEGDVVKIKKEKGELIFNIEKSSLVNVIKKKYQCQSCQYSFEQEIIINTTVICPKCLKIIKDNNEKDFKPIN